MLIAKEDTKISYARIIVKIRTDGESKTIQAEG